MHSSAVEVPDRTTWCAAQLAREAVSALDCALSNDALVGPCRAPEPKSIQPNVDVGALRSSRRFSARASRRRDVSWAHGGGHSSPRGRKNRGGNGEAAKDDIFVHSFFATFATFATFSPGTGLLAGLRRNLT